MLSSVLRSPRAVQVNIEIMRAFVRLRQMLQTNVDLARKLAVLEKRRYDAQFRAVFDAIRDLMTTARKDRSGGSGFSKVGRELGYRISSGPTSLGQVPLRL